MKFGYARCSTTGQDIEVQRRELVALGVDEVAVDKGYTGANRDRPGLTTVLDKLRSGDTLAVTKLDRLARSVTDAHAIASTVHERGAALQIGGSVYDPADPTGKLLFTVLAMVAEFERDLISQRTREGLAVAREQGRLKGKKPKLTAAQDAEVIRWVREGRLTQAQMERILGVSPSTITRTIQRLRAVGRIG